MHSKCKIDNKLVLRGSDLAGFSFKAGKRTFRPVVSYSMSGTFMPIFEGFFFIIFHHYNLLLKHLMNLLNRG